MRALVPAAERARGRSHRAKPSLEGLETRAMLSRAGPIPAALPAAQVRGTASSENTLLSQQSLHRHPSLETIEKGRVENRANFYPLYAGPRRRDLYAVGAKARYFNDRFFVFTGLTVGPINSSNSSFYVFGINRGGASPPGPFPGRPMIDFDAEVIAATNPDGYEAEVELLNSNGQATSTTSLVNTAVVFRHNQVQVFVPVQDLPSTSAPGTPERRNYYSFAFWAGISPSTPRAIASFVPEYANTSVVAASFRST